MSQGDLSLVFNPKNKISADVTIFTDKKSSAFAKAPADKAGFVIDGPGEYEIKDIFIKGFPGNIFLITFEGIKVCFLGSQGIPELPDVDILFVPVNAYKAAVTIEPSVMIPMGYDKSTLAQFLKEAGEKDVVPLDKLVVKKKDLEGKEGDVIILKEE